ncbi:MAG: NADP-dependent malic enzyme [Endomicrobium sp.]|jgi:malate dehydrogenase (oxaloacetate-decarboxylating)|nr:NADP-dependent malic enzyme [Endomicrobium sp.]
MEIKTDQKLLNKNVIRKRHSLYRGKVEVVPKCSVTSFNDFAVWYSPGVATVCEDIHKNPELVYEYTNKANSVAIISDGTRVLGLGNIGPLAGLPVMEGKSLLYKYLGGIDAYPICLDTNNEDEIVRTVQILQPSFGGINLEDIEQPKCFPVLTKLTKVCKIPVWHDDQQGTAIVILAGLINALKVVNKNIKSIQVAIIGAGAANICISKLLLMYGVNPAKMIVVDSKGILNKNRTDLQLYPEKQLLAMQTNFDNINGGIKEAMINSDVVIALSSPGPNIINKNWICNMATNPIIFACANPVPEIWPWQAKESGAVVVATGRSDFNNQINNSLGFPGVFRGVLDVRASSITDNMCISAAIELSSCIKNTQLHPNKILPTMDDWYIYPKIAAAVGLSAIKEKVADNILSYEEIFNNAKLIIQRSRAITKTMIERGYIKKVERNKI